MPIGTSDGEFYASEMDYQLAQVQPKPDNFTQATKDLNLNPEEQGLYQRHLHNLTGPGGVDNPDGSRSTLYQAVQEHEGKFYNVPTVWDGKRETEPFTQPDTGKVFDVPNKTALDNIAKEGWDKFPSYSTPEEADQRYESMHKYMEKDTSDYMRNRSTMPPGATEKPAGAFNSDLGSGVAGTSATLVSDRKWEDLSSEQQNEIRESWKDIYDYKLPLEQSPIEKRLNQKVPQTKEEWFQQLPPNRSIGIFPKYKDKTRTPEEQKVYDNMLKSLPDDIEHYITPDGGEYFFRRAPLVSDLNSGAAAKPGSTIPATPDPTKPILSYSGVQDSIKSVAEGLASPYESLGKLITGQSEEVGPDIANAAQAVLPELKGAAALGVKPLMSIFAGVGAKTFNKAALDTAKEMAVNGEHPTVTWLKTGMFQGADNQWRFEIPDIGASIKKKGLLPWKTIEPDPNAPSGWNVIEGDGKDRFELNPGKLSDVLDHPELYKAYPHLKDIPVEPHLGPYGSGRFDGQTISVAGGTPEELKTVLLHEVQHAVQDKEGFSKGGNAKAIEPLAEHYLLQAGADRTAPDFRDKVKYLSIEAYRRLAGEVESRNVETRQNMNYLQRSFRPPVTTEDRPRDIQTVRTRWENKP